MKPPLSIDKYYRTHLSRSQITDELTQLTSEEKIKGLKSDAFATQVSETGFVIERNAKVADESTLMQYPNIQGFYFSENPFVINIVIKPNYFAIMFFCNLRIYFYSDVHFHR